VSESQEINEFVSSSLNFMVQMYEQYLDLPNF